MINIAEINSLLAGLDASSINRALGTDAPYSYQGEINSQLGHLRTHFLDILGVAPRIYELRHKYGHNIVTRFTHEEYGARCILEYLVRRQGEPVTMGRLRPRVRLFRGVPIKILPAAH